MSSLEIRVVRQYRRSSLYLSIFQSAVQAEDGDLIEPVLLSLRLSAASIVDLRSKKRSNNRPPADGSDKRPK